MTQLDIGPVVGQIGGRVEVITEEVTVAGESRTWVLPDGWEEGVIGAEGTHSAGTRSGSNTVFGTQPRSAFETAPVHGFQSLDQPAIIDMTDRDHSWSGTVTMIRTA